MKKNLYIIMSEAEIPELEPLLENTECEIPEGISAENIAAKVKTKRKKAKAKTCAAFIRLGALAACFALMIAAVPAAQYFGNSQTTNDKLYHEGISNGVSVPEIGFVTSPSIAFDTSISYFYYLPLENDACLVKEIFFKLEEGKMKETWRELLAPFFAHIGADTSVAEWKLTETDGKTEVSADGNFVTHTPSVKTVHIYLEGEDALDDHTLKCLVNTIDSISYVRYIKLYMNGEPMVIEGKCPAEGFVNFHIAGTAE